ncbi:MAG: hypothetical protein BWX48_02892 [Verrucomicrobia bacterium ADurb.Bin006]|nr:MAG: hypothetical protein BWX48_02892 [Verrucomicrobia bacterium ADurb.Bin006]
MSGGEREGREIPAGHFRERGYDRAVSLVCVQKGSNVLAHARGSGFVNREAAGYGEDTRL